MTAFDDLAARVADLESRMEQVPTDNARATVELQRGLETSWQPDGDTFLLPHSVGGRALEPVPAWQCSGTTLVPNSGAATNCDGTGAGGSPFVINMNIVPNMTGLPTKDQQSVNGAWQFRCVVPGVYRIHVAMFFNGGALASNLIYGAIAINGTVLFGGEFSYSLAAPAVGPRINFSSTNRLVSGDLVHCQAAHLYAAAELVVCQFECIWEGPTTKAPISTLNPSIVIEPT